MTSSRFPSERPRNKAFLDRAAEDFAERAICEEGQVLVQEIFVDWLVGYERPYTTYFKPSSVLSGGRDATGRVLLSVPRYLRIKKRFDKLGGEGGVGCSWETLVDRSKALVQVGIADRGTTGCSGDAETTEPDTNDNPFLSDDSSISSQGERRTAGTFFLSKLSSLLFAGGR